MCWDACLQISYVGFPLPFSGAWSAMFWAGQLNMRPLPTAAGAAIGVVISSLIGLGIGLTGEWKARGPSA